MLLLHAPPTQAVFKVKMVKARPAQIRKVFGKDHMCKAVLADRKKCFATILKPFQQKVNEP